jgi:hypothetical protein
VLVSRRPISSGRSSSPPATGKGVIHDFRSPKIMNDPFSGCLFRLTGLAEVEERPAAEVIDDILRLARRRDPKGAIAGPPRTTEATSK